LIAKIDAEFNPFRLTSPLMLAADFVAADHEQRDEGVNHFASTIQVCS